MSLIVSFEDYRPPARFDAVPWATAFIYEAEASDGPWTQIDTITLTPPDPDPADPQERSFTTANATAADLWYRVVFVDGASAQSLPTTAIQNTGIEPYATPDEFFRILKVRAPTEEQTEAAKGDLGTATLEINAEIDWPDDHADATVEQRDLLKGVCLDRAADLWRHRESVPGVLGALDESLMQPPLRYSWERYAQRLAPLKEQWGLA